MASKTPYEAPRAVSFKTKLDQLSHTTAETAEKLVAEKLPEKIFDLTKLLDSPSSVFHVGELPPTATGEATTPAKKRKTPEEGEKEKSIVVSEAAVPCNDLILQQHAAMKAEVDELIAIMNKVKLWVQLSIPRVEDGNNFGVAIQEDTIQELARTEDYGFSLLEQFSKYHVTRTQLIAKIIKYPNVQDAVLAVRSLDEREMRNTRLSLVEIRNSYLVLYDMVYKNFERIKTPRASNHTASMF